MKPSPDVPPADRKTAPELRLSYGWSTDRGLRRELNEDSCIASVPIFAVADGMGGHAAGEVASELCIRALTGLAGPGADGAGITAASLQRCLVDADSAIREATGAQAGTTVTAAAFVKHLGAPYWLVMNLGDSRTYRLSKGKLQQVSVDHSEVQELIDAGEITPEQAAVHPRRHVVTRALGAGDGVEADYWLLPAEAGDRILLCSDGLTGELTDGQILQLLDPAAHPQEAAEALVQAALDSGGRDNITVIVVDAVEDHSAVS